MQTPYSISSTLYYVSVSSVMKTSTPDVGKKHYFEVTQLWRVLERGPSTDRPFMYSAVLDQFNTKVSVPAPAISTILVQLLHTHFFEFF